MSCYCVMCEHHRSAEVLLRKRGEPVPESIDTTLAATPASPSEEMGRLVDTYRDEICSFVSKLPLQRGPFATAEEAFADTPHASVLEARNALFSAISRLEAALTDASAKLAAESELADVRGQEIARLEAERAARRYDDEDMKKLAAWVQENLQHYAGLSWSEAIVREFAYIHALRARNAKLAAWLHDARLPDDPFPVPESISQMVARVEREEGKA